MWCRLSRDVALAGHLLDQDSPRCHVTLPQLKYSNKFDNLNSIKLSMLSPSVIFFFSVLPFFISSSCEISDLSWAIFSSILLFHQGSFLTDDGGGYTFSPNSSLTACAAALRSVLVSVML